MNENGTNFPRKKKKTEPNQEQKTKPIYDLRYKNSPFSIDFYNRVIELMTNPDLRATKNYWIEHTMMSGV